MGLNVNSEALDSRQYVIQSMLDCVEGGMQENYLTWDDVCSFRPNKRSDKSIKEQKAAYRRKMVGHQLDIVEDQLKQYSGRKIVVTEVEFPEILPQRQFNIITPKNFDVEMELLAVSGVDEKSVIEKEPSFEYLEGEPYVLSQSRLQDVIKEMDDLKSFDNIVVKNPKKKFNFMNDFEYMRTDVQVVMGRRIDDLAWGVSGDNSGANPNRDNDTEWNKINLFQIKTKGRMLFNNGALLDGSVAYGKAYKGEVLETRYLEDDRINIIEQISGNGDHGHTWDFSIGFGWEHEVKEKWLFEIDDVKFTPLVGYSFHRQDFDFTNGVQRVDKVSGFPLGPFDGLGNNYMAEWDGPWLGFEISGRMKRLLTILRWEYHFFDYYAEGTYNLRTDLRQPVSFTQNADGHGIVFAIDLGYEVNDDLTLNFIADLWEFRADPGSDILFEADGDQFDQRFNDAVLKSHSFMMGATYKFQ